jgi:hypothetical protein
MATSAADLNSFPTETNSPVSDLFRVGTYGKRRDTCGQVRTFAHPAEGSSFHYRRGALTCGTAACSCTACHSRWLREEREAVLRRADQLFDLEVGEIAAARTKIAELFTAWVKDNCRGPRPATPGKNEVSRADLEKCWTVYPDEPLEGDPLKWGAKIARRVTQGAAYSLHMESCPISHMPGPHLHFYGSRGLEGTPGLIVTYSDDPIDVFVTEMLDFSTVRATSREALPKAPPGATRKVSFTKAVKWVGEWACRPPKGAVKVPSGRAIVKAGSFGKALRCPECGEDVARSAWKQVEFVGQEPKDEWGSVDRRGIRLLGGSRAWEDY